MHNTDDLKEGKNGGWKAAMVKRSTCLTCFRSSPKQENHYEAICPHCKGSMSAGITAKEVEESNDVAVLKSICIKKCGGKDKLSKWEEILHRPKCGAKGF